MKPVVKTVYVPPTATKGARVRASYVGKTVIIKHVDETSFKLAAMHVLAAVGETVREENVIGGIYGDDGVIWVQL